MAFKIAALQSVILCLILAIASLSSALQQKVHDSAFHPDYVLRITQEDVPLACTSRLSTLVNGTIPGPAIYLKENKVTWVRIYNDMDSRNLTVHWHGLSQSAAPYSDGTPQASQWPIKAKHFFDYEIKPKVGEAGTYFYHSHVDFQAVTASGPLIVEEEAGQSSPYKYDAEKTMFISELYNRTDEMILRGLTKSEKAFKWSGEAETFLVNGQSYRGMGPKQTIAPRPWSKPNLAVQTTCGPEVIEVEPDKTYRIRAIGGMALSLVTFAFENHNDLSVIAADAGYTKPARTDHIQVGPGQRFDFLLHTKTETELKKLGKSQFWIQLENRLRPVNVTSYAILSYKLAGQDSQSAPPSPPAKHAMVIPHKTQDWLEYTLEPLKPNGFPSASEVTRRVYITSANLVKQNGIWWTADNNTWTEFNEHLGGAPYYDTSPSVGVPYLVNVYKKGEKAIPDYDKAVRKHGGWDPHLNVYPAKVGEVIDIILVNQPNGNSGGFDAHPWHIHGDHVYDLGSGPGKYNATANEEKLKGYNPVRRDTSYLYKHTDTDLQSAQYDDLIYTSQGWRAWRLRVDNAGVWMVHCHVLQHMIMGMQSVWVMGNASQITKGTSASYSHGYMTYGGNAYGNMDRNPVVNHYFDD